MIAESLKNDPKLAAIVTRLIGELQPERIFLFGSAARDDGGPDSDYDLLILVAETDEPLYRTSRRAHSLLWGLGVSADILVWTQKAFDARVHLKASLPSTVLREGKLLYAA